MSIRLPLQGVLDITQTDVSGSVLGGWAYPFKLPQDTDNIVVKFQPSVVAGGASALFQTSDDGGNTWYDVARTSVASNNAVGTGPEWLSIPVISSGVNPLVVSNAQVGSVAGGTIGSARASTLGSRQVSGLPVLGLQNRIFVQTVGNATAVSARVQVLVNSQSATA